MCILSDGRWKNIATTWLYWMDMEVSDTVKYPQTYHNIFHCGRGRLVSYLPRNRILLDYSLYWKVRGKWSMSFVISLACKKKSHLVGPHFASLKLLVIQKLSYTGSTIIVTSPLSTNEICLEKVVVFEGWRPSTGFVELNDKTLRRIMNILLLRLLLHFACEKMMWSWFLYTTNIIMLQIYSKLLTVFLLHGWQLSA